MTSNGRPRWLTEVLTPYTSRGPEVVEFAETCCRVTKDSLGGNVGDLMVIRPWQKQLFNQLLATDGLGLLRHRTGLVLVPRKNGKSSLSAVLALWSLVYGPQGGEVFSVAGDKDQARLVFEQAKKMVQADPGLSSALTIYRDSIVLEATGSAYKVRSADAGLAQGLDPSFCVFDEVEVQPSRELWDAMDLGRGARAESLLLGISTAGPKSDSRGQDTLAYGLYQYGVRVASKEIDDQTFFFASWEPRKPNADWRSPEVWAEANPGYGDIVGEADFRSTIKKTPEAVFRTYRLCQWVNSRSSWLPTGAWESCADEERSLVPGETPVVFGFDGARSQDATALVLATVEKDPHIVLLKLWERPLGDQQWRVSDSDVVPVLKALAEEWQPKEIVADVAYWHDQLQDLADEGLPVVQYPQTGGYMVPATAAFYEAVVNRHLTHDGNASLARHVENTTVKNTPAGARISKESTMSSRKIDATVAAVMAFRRARDLAGPSEAEGVGALSLSQASRNADSTRIDRLIKERNERIDRLRRAAMMKQEQAA